VFGPVRNNLAALFRPATVLLKLYLWEISHMTHQLSAFSFGYLAM
jgi:hypothetical protein